MNQQLVCKEVVLRNFFIIPRAQYSYPWGTTEQILMLNFMLVVLCYRTTFLTMSQFHLCVKQSLV